MKSISLLILLTICGCSPEYKVVGVTDGDTVTVLRDKRQIKVRLWGIDAPEKKQAFGSKSKEVLSSKIFGKEVSLEIKNKDLYGRTVANIYLGKRWINKEMVEEGMAWHYKQYARHSKELAEAEQKAREKKLGLWIDKHPISPGEFRSESKNKKR